MLRASLKSLCILPLFAGCNSAGNRSHPSTKPGPAPSIAVVPPAAAQKLYEQVKPSLVAVQYTYAGELGRREIIGEGVVVRGDGLVMIPMALFPVQLPNQQMIDFKIIVPGDAETELEAEFQGRD